MTNMSRTRILSTNRLNLHTCWTLCWRGGLLLAALVVSVASSGSEGDRAKSGQCPPGEVCSPDTPQGLYFKGPTFGDDAILPDRDVGFTAVGGTQTIEIDQAGWGTLTDFDARCSGSAFDLESVAPPFVRVRADTIGSCMLRIVDPNNGELYDRLTIESLPVQHVAVLSSVPSFLVQNWQHHPSRLYYSGANIQWLAQLTNGGTRLVDESLVFSVGDANSTAVISSTRWDRATILPASDATRLEVTVTTGSGATGIGEVQLTHEIDRIEEGEGEELPETIDASELLGASFIGLTADDRYVYGLDWTVVAIAPDGTVSDRVMMWGGRLMGFLEQVGVWELEISAANITHVFQITSTPHVAAPAPPAPAPPAPAPPAPAPDAQPDPEATPTATDLRSTPGWRATRFLSKLSAQANHR